MSTQGLAKPQQSRTALDTLRGLLESKKSEFQYVIPKHLSTDRLVRIAVTACAKTPKLLECTPASVLSSVMAAAQLGLEPGGPLGSAYLVPYKNTCQLIVGYRGLIDLARRSGQIQSIEAHVVHEHDRFTCSYGLDPVLEHSPDWGAEPGPMLAVYAVAKLKDGGTQCEVMTKRQVDAIRQRSLASGSGPWATDYEEMARKTVVRRLCKYLPLSVELAKALELEEGVEAGIAPEIDITPEDAALVPPPSKTESIRNRLASAKGATTDESSRGSFPVIDEIEGTVTIAGETHQ